jgi:hypothetical protein
MSDVFMNTDDDDGDDDDLNIDRNSDIWLV